MNHVRTDSYPLVFSAPAVDAYGPQAGQTGNDPGFRTICRALAGMQKEAIVRHGVNGPCWRMLSDEGPWLNGTDLAPFPLAFFTTGLVSSYLTEYAAAAAEQGLALASLALSIDNYYSMEGSALSGTLRGSALPVEITFRVKAQASRERLLQLAYAAAARSAADAFLRSSLESHFTLTANGVRVDLENGEGAALKVPADPSPLFTAARPCTDAPAAGDIIKKCQAGEAAANHEAVGLKTEQKRIVHVHGEGFLRDDGLKQTEVACIKPAGSLFRFLSDEPPAEGGDGRAPSGLAYLSAGLSFCFMTQLGRYAKLAKQDLEAYHIIQDTRFTRAAADAVPRVAKAGDIDTHVFVQSNEDDAASRQLVRMGEQTCYLHAAGHTALKNRIRLKETR